MAPRKSFSAILLSDSIHRVEDSCPESLGGTQDIVNEKND